MPSSRHLCADEGLERIFLDSDDDDDNENDVEELNSSDSCSESEIENCSPSTLPEDLCSGYVKLILN